MTRLFALVASFALAACAAPKDPTPAPAPAAAGATATAAALPPAPVEHDVEPADATPAAPSYEPRPGDLIANLHQPLENPEALAGFFEALAAVDNGDKRMVRVVHLGASMIGADDLPSVLREKFQTRFGDGGAGMVLMQRYTPNYLHRWVNLSAQGWEHCYIAYLCKKDGHYGLGGTTFWSKGGATTTISTRKHELGGEAAFFELWYMARPGGGRLEIKVDKEPAQVIETQADTVEDRFHPISLERGPHKIRVRAVGYGNARAYGVVVETDGPGLVWDQFSKIGVFTKRILAWDPEHIKGQVRHRDPDLLVFTYGGNDLRRVSNAKLTREQYIEEYSEAISHIRAGKPEAACLITSITDRAKSLNFDILPKHVEIIVSAQREVATKLGCGFFDTWTAMGGGGSLIEWRDSRPPLAAKDLKHLNHRGRVKVGGWMYDAIITAYVEHRRGKAGSN